MKSWNRSKVVRYVFIAAMLLGLFINIISLDIRTVKAQNAPTIESTVAPTIKCMTNSELVNIANRHILIQVNAGNTPNWVNAHASNPTAYYDLENNVVAFMLSVIDAKSNGDIGYIVIQPETCLVIEFAEVAPPHTYSLAQAKAIASQWDFQLDTSHPVYLTPVDKYFVLHPVSTNDFQVLLQMDDFSYVILDKNLAVIKQLPDGKQLPLPKLNLDLLPPRDSYSDTQEKENWQPSSATKELVTPDYEQFWHGSCYVGCTPTAGGTLIGYWANRGYPNLIDSSWQNMVIQLHDRAGTFCSGNAGFTWYTNLEGALEGYTNDKGYPGFSSTTYSSDQSSFAILQGEIDNDRPLAVHFAWDEINTITYINGHSNTGVGYNTVGGNYMIVKTNASNLGFPYKTQILYKGAGPYPGWLMYTTLVPPPQDNAAYVGQSGYPTVPMGGTFQIYFDLKNTGTTTWTPGSYWLQNTNNAPLGASPQQPITTNVAPGETYRWTINMTAPTATGVYRTQWAPSHNGTTFGLVGVSMYIDVTVTTLCGAVTEIPQSECNALQDLYNSTNGANWTNKTGWVQTTTPCSWYGVTCASGHVTKLTLHRNNLAGSLPDSLGTLSQLKELRFSFNQLSGNIPSTLGNLSNLTFLALSVNQLSGGIPSEIGNLSQLQYLLLGTNQLSGNIPTTLGNLSNLYTISIDINQLSGNIPAELGKLSKLKEFWLGDNMLTGAIPWQLGNLSNLQHLYLQNNQLTGSIPNSLGSLSQLTELRVDGNQLTGSIPSELGNLANLEYLSLFSNQLTGSIPPELGNLTNLIRLSLFFNQLTGPIPPQLGSLTNLVELGLTGNQLSGSIPPELGSLSNLGRLDLESNQLSGSIPPELGSLTNLEFLGLSGNQLSGSIPPELGNLTNLNFLYLSSNQLIGSIPPELGNLSNLWYLSLGNQLSGSIPPELGNLTNLLWLDLSGNQLSGSIPPELGLTNLYYLYLSSNQLTGSIPPELGNLTNLTRLYLNGNQLSGSIPPELGSLSNLEYLYLNDTQLTGEIPVSFTNLSSLVNLTLSCGLTSTDPAVISFIDGILGVGWDEECSFTLFLPLILR